MMMILEIAEGVKFEEMPEAQQKVIGSLGIEWPQSMMIGTEAVNGKQLVLINANCTPKQLNDAMNGDYNTGEFDENGDPVVESFNLGWSIMAVEGVEVAQTELLPYFLPELNVTYDDNGDPITESIPITDLTGKLQVWAGKKWVY